MVLPRRQSMLGYHLGDLISSVLIGRKVGSVRRPIEGPKVAGQRNQAYDESADIASGDLGMEVLSGQVVQAVNASSHIVMGAKDRSAGGVGGGSLDGLP
jgi:hypothetical protein